MRVVAKLLLAVACGLSCGAAAPADRDALIALCTKAQPEPGGIEACTALLASEQNAGRRATFLTARASGYLLALKPLNALADLDAVAAIAPEQPSTAFGRAYAFYELQLFARALSEIQKAIAGGLTNAFSWGLRGTIYLELGQPANAVHDLDLSLLGAMTPVGYLARGRANEELGHFDRAVIDFTAAILLDPANSEAYYARAKVHYGLDRYAEALADFRRAAKLTPERAGTQAYIAELEALLASNQPVPLPPPTGALGLVPSKVVGHTHHCGSYYPTLSERLAEAGDPIVRYDVGVDGTVSNVALARSSGNERLDTAAVLCVRSHWRNTPAYQDGIAVASPGHDAMIRFLPAVMPEEHVLEWRGHVFAGLGDYVKAQEAYDALIAMKPDDADLRLRRGLVHFVARDYARAIADFDEALRLKPDDSDAAVARALAQSAAAADAAKPPPRTAI